MSTTFLEKFRLTLNPDDSGTREYVMYPIQNIEIRSRKDALSIAPPGLAARENILLGVSGMEADISVEFTIYDDGSDRARGTHTTQVVDVDDQIRYLEDTMHAPDFDATWEFNHITGTAINNAEVFLETVEPTVLNVDSPKWKSCRMTLRRGGSV